MLLATSATFGHGKTRLLKRISSLKSEHSATAEQIGKAGTRLYVLTYGGRQEDSLNSLRYINLWKWYHQVRHLRTPYRKSSTLSQFTGSLTSYNLVSNNILDPKQWGWKLEGSIYIHQ